MGVPVNLQHIFRTSFPKITSGHLELQYTSGNGCMTRRNIAGNVEFSFFPKTLHLYLKLKHEIKMFSEIAYIIFKQKATHVKKESERKKSNP